MTSETRRPLFNRALAGVLAFCLLASTLTGCYGRFPLTNAVYDLNGRVTDNHIVHSILMVVLAILPVYKFCIIIDALIINSIEYWTGKDINGTSAYEQPDGTTAVLMPGAHADEAILTVWRGEEKLVERRYLRQGDGLTHIVDESGAIVAKVQASADGSIAVSDANGVPVRDLSATEIATFKAGASL
jgi:hypothetical protein